MNILITGITWFVWKKLSIKLKNNWHNIFWLVRKDSNKNFLIDNNIGFFIYKNNNLELEIFLRENKIDCIIHLATLYLISNDLNDIDNLINSNVTLWTKLLELSSNIWIKWFINTSSFIQNYENKYYSPQNLYAATKQAFEDIWKYYYESWKINFVSISLVNTYWKWDTRKKIFNIWDNISKTWEELNSTSWEQYIDILYVDDIVNAYLQLLNLIEKNLENINWKKFTVSSWKIIKLKELAKIFEDVSWKKLNINWWWIPHRDREVIYPYNIWEKIPWWEAKIRIEEWIKKFLNINN